MDREIHKQYHGYRNGHQLLGSSIKLSKVDQDLVDRLSDISGSVRPGERFEPYFTLYPLPNREFYTVSRTWQDLQAPRAGCVLTKSILIPMGLWDEPFALLKALKFLTAFEKDFSDLRTWDDVSVDDKFPPLSADPPYQLIEAFFLEARKPIVVFNLDNADALMVRLVSSLWPALKRNIFACSFALSPRAVNGRPFDILFAPNDVRARFSDWPGRKIQKSVHVLSPRHDWTQGLYESVFASDAPSFKPIDELGILARDEIGDEANLRLVFRWNELKSRAETSPFAVLGMLDIVNSRKLWNSDLANSISALIETSIAALPELEDISNAWQYLLAIRGKAEDFLLTSRLIAQIKFTAERMTIKNGQAAIGLLAALRLNNRPLPNEVAEGIGDGLGEVIKLLGFPHNFGEIDNLQQIKLLELSSAYAFSYLANIKNGENSFAASQLISALETNEKPLSKALIENVIMNISNDSHVPLLSSSIAHINSNMVDNVFEHLLVETNFSISDLNNTILSASLAPFSKEKLRNIALRFKFSDTREFLLESLVCSQSNFHWLMTEPNLARDARVSLLQDLILKSENYELSKALDGNDEGNAVATELATGLPDTANALAKLLNSVQLNVHFQVKYLLALNKIKYTLVEDAFFKRTLQKILTDDSINDADTIVSLINATPIHYDFRWIISQATERNLTSNKISFNICALNSSESLIRDKILNNIEYLSSKINTYPKRIISSEAAAAWSSMLSDSGKSNRQGQLVAANQALAYAFEHTRIPVSPLVIVAFPISYKQLKLQNNGPGFMDMLFPFEWDKCKMARRDLVDAFLKSNWPSTDLVLAADAAGDLDKVLRYLKYDCYKSGRDYVNRLIKESAVLPKKLQNAIRIGK